MKKTWKLLPKIFGDQFRITEGEAIQILQEQLFSKNWKHGKAGKLGRMWTDPVIINEFNSLLKAEDKIAKTITRKKVQQELFKSAACLRFCQVAGLKYRGYLNFKNVVIHGFDFFQNGKEHYFDNKIKSWLFNLSWIKKGANNYFM